MEDKTTLQMCDDLAIAVDRLRDLGLIDPPIEKTSFTLALEGLVKASIQTAQYMKNNPVLWKISKR